MNTETISQAIRLIFLPSSPFLVVSSCRVCSILKGVTLPNRDLVCSECLTRGEALREVGVDTVGRGGRDVAKDGGDVCSNVERISILLLGRF